MAKVSFPEGYVEVETKKRGREPRNIGELFADMKEIGDGFILPELYGPKLDENGNTMLDAKGNIVLDTSVTLPGFKNKPQVSGALGKQVTEYARTRKIPVKWDVKYNAITKDWRVMVTRTIK